MIADGGGEQTDEKDKTRYDYHDYVYYWYSYDYDYDYYGGDYDYYTRALWWDRVCARMRKCSVLYLFRAGALWHCLLLISSTSLTHRRALRIGLTHRRALRVNERASAP